MSRESMQVFFGMLALVALVGGVGLIVLRLLPWPAGRRVGATIAESSTWLAWLVAAVATAGSLYFSEVAHFTPCKLCWYQRIAIYPLSIVLLVAAIRRDRHVGWYVIPVATIGALFAAYQTQLQAFPHQHSSFCSLTEPCTTRYVWEF